MEDTDYCIRCNKEVDHSMNIKWNNTFPYPILIKKDKEIVAELSRSITRYDFIGKHTDNYTLAYRQPNGTIGPWVGYGRGFNPVGD